MQPTHNWCVPTNRTAFAHPLPALALCLVIGPLRVIQSHMLILLLLFCSPFCKNHGHLHRCYAKGHFEICPKHGYHSIMNGCFHCVRVERAEKRRHKKAAGITTGKAIGSSVADEQGDA